jgi:perosamine synthetase
MNELLALIESKASQSPHVLGGPAVRPDGVAETPHDPAVSEVLRSLAATNEWRAYSGRHSASLVDVLAAGHGHSGGRLCSSGTVAVQLALEGLAVGPGDEVILSAYDFRGNFGDIVHLGATPVLVDVRPDNGQIDEMQIESALSNRTKAAIISHLHGGVAAMSAIRDWADRRGVPLIEDACQCPGADVDGRPAGAWGDVAVQSFGGSKLVSAGRGGAVLTSRPDVLQRMKLAAVRGNDAYPLSEMQAAIILPQWRKLDADNKRRTEAARTLCRWIGRAEVRCVVPWIAEEEGAIGLYKLGFRFDPAQCGGLSRDQFVHAVRAEGIPADAGFRALHLSHARRRFRQVGALPNATDLDASVVVLHHTALIGEESDLALVAAAFRKVERFADQLTGLELPPPDRQLPSEGD